MDVGKTIRELRKLHGISQAELARALEFSQSHLSLVEDGKRTMHQSGLERVGAYFNLPIGLLFFLSMSETDVPENRRPLFRQTKPQIDEMLKKLFPVKSADDEEDI